MVKRMLYKIPRVHRFNYWGVRDIDPIKRGWNFEEADALSEERLSNGYKKSFESDDEEAIFKFMKATRRAYRADWVLNQIERWHKEASHQARQKVLKLAAYYMGTQGYRRSSVLIEEVERDQKVLRYILRKRSNRKLKDDLFPEAAKKFGISRREIRKVWANYQGLWASHEAACARYDMELQSIYPGYKFSNARFLWYLQICLKNLRRYSKAMPL